MKLRKAPPGVELITDKLEEFEARTREALNTPIDDKRRNELSWPMHRIHYEKNRYLYDMHHKHKRISKKLLDYLIREKLADGKLMAKWRKPGYERLCSLLAITKSNTNFRTVSVCRTPLKDRTGQILPNVMTGCVSCASGDGGPIWWNDPIPDIVKKRIAEIDPGKAELVDNMVGKSSNSKNVHDQEDLDVAHEAPDLETAGSSIRHNTEPRQSEANSALAHVENDRQL